MILSKLVDITCASTSKIAQRYFQTVRSVQPETTAGIVQGIGFESIALPEKKIPPEIRREAGIADILQQVEALDGLPPIPSHIEHLVGRATKGKSYQNHILSQQKAKASSLNKDHDGHLNYPKQKYDVGGIDIAEKTQLILQSPHPVRYVIEREVHKSQQGFHRRLPSYHTWIMLFGRSLMSNQNRSESAYDRLLNHVANASDSGMFSSDIHQTILDIPDEHPSIGNCSAQLHMGNKYAVLVGDYFAIRCLYNAEKTKTNSVMVAITEGVEEFTCSFGASLLDKTVGYPQLLSPNASVLDWILHSQKAFGYFRGGLYAALSLQMKPNDRLKVERQMASLVSNLSLFLKAAAEMEALQEANSFVPSPFLLTSLPAVLYQSEHPHMFADLRKRGYELDNDYIRELQTIICRSSTSQRARNLITDFATETKQAFHHLAKDQYYTNVFDSLIDAVKDECV
ncbi:hypothetical protein Ocin01_05458 [Orchesella cincta]|uniref:Decaprenyl-diphosphate synthase subunit 2 n=1 Tax=Orchesella cincta TaxID=48709 RepID=A0A1D2N7G6_ORCCI|nr:hypothetical protein Ocin01_05458 [Orchesella cincta]